jgi:hypothetical protein
MQAAAGVSPVVSEPVGDTSDGDYNESEQPAIEQPTEDDLEVSIEDMLDEANKILDERKSSTETQGGGQAAGGTSLSVETQTDADPSVSNNVIPPVSGEQNPPAPPSLPDEVASIEIPGEDGKPVKIEMNLKEAGEKLSSKRDILLKLMDCVQK